MAYEGYDATIYSSLSGSGFTSTCLEGIPFKIGPKFKPPTRVVLPPDFDLRTAQRSSVLNSEYTFEVEEAVLKWSAEREKQKEERLELQRQATLRKSQESSSSESHADIEEIDGESQSEPLYENAGVLQPKPAPKPRPRPKPAANYATVTIPNSLIANISNDILQPTPIQSTSSKENCLIGETDKNVSSKSDIDLSWFEKQDDPFDNLELKTINDMEELASVLQNSSNVSQKTEEQNPEGFQPQVNSIPDMENIAINASYVKNPERKDAEPVDIETDTDNVGDIDADDEHFYENVNLVPIKNGPVKSGTSPNSSMLDLSKLPPVPPRRDLVGRVSPLPPIGQSIDVASLNPPTNSVVDSVTSQTSLPSNSVNQSVTISNNVNTNLPFQSTDFGKSSTINHRAPVKKPPRTFKYSRHVEPEFGAVNNTVVEQSNSESKEQSQANPISTSFSNGNFSVQYNNTQTNTKVSEDNEDIELRFESDHFGDKMSSRPVPAPRHTASPPPRPSSGQSWNRYSPLPPTPVQVDQPQPTTVALPVISSGAESNNQLSKEAQTAVRNLVGMGFPKNRVVRAVEKLGEDEKEIVEFLCLVDQLTDKGYSLQLAETALLMFRNSMNQASSFLELFTQFQELGFSGDKIKEALMNTNNDREKTLDILTASS